MKISTVRMDKGKMLWTEGKGHPSAMALVSKKRLP